MRIYKKQVEIKGYGKFDKICNVSKKGCFTIKHPKKIILKDITEIGEVYGYTLKEVESKWSEEVNIFENLTYKYETIIMYELEERGSYKDGTGIGFVFNWGVFRMVNKGGYDKEYFHERGGNSSKKELINAWHNFKNWKKITWTKEREEFFIKLNNSISDMYSKLEQFCESMEEYKVKEALLLEEDNEE